METCEASDKQVEVQSNVNQVLVECLRKADDVCVPFLSEEEKERKKKQIIAAYSYYGVEVEQVVVHEGSAVSLYEITVKRGTRVMLVRDLEEDFLSQLSWRARMVIPKPWSGRLHVELPNDRERFVPLRALIEQAEFQDTGKELPVPVGFSVEGKPLVGDLATMHHLLVGGATGQGKTVFLNSLIVSLLCRKRPDDLKLVLLNPKSVGFDVYTGLGKAYLAQLPGGGNAVVNGIEVLEVLHSLGAEMDLRIELLRHAQTLSFSEYNRLFDEGQLDAAAGHKHLPYIVVVMDEYGDYMMMYGRDFEQPLCRLLQIGHRVGIHVVIATQRPTSNIVTGIIKANIPARIAFRVDSRVSSRLILDDKGAECLIGRGDLLFSQGFELCRAQGTFVDMPEIDAVVRRVSECGYAQVYELPPLPKAEVAEKSDPLLPEAVKYAKRAKGITISKLQKHFAIGYNRARGLFEHLRSTGVIKEE